MSYPLNNNCFGDIFKARDPRLNDKKYKQKASTITVSRKILAVTKEQAEKILKDENEKAMKLHAEEHGHSHDTKKKDTKKASSKQEVIAKKKPSTSDKKTSKSKLNFFV